jgi:hypothetical protein
VAKTIIFYRTEDGRCPVEEFLDSLPGNAAQKVTWTLSLIEEHDIVPSSYFKKLVGTEEIWNVGFRLPLMLIGYSVSSRAGQLLFLPMVLLRRQKRPRTGRSRRQSPIGEII